jgi:glycosyltransferase involved in cell wall biosynthesis
MRVAHIGPPLGRTGGASGYLLQLRGALGGLDTDPHQLMFPDEATAAVAAPAQSPARRLAGRLKRMLFGKPTFYRPDARGLQETHGPLDSHIGTAVAEMRTLAEPLVARFGDAADVMIAHDLGSAEAALARRRKRQSIWAMVHTPMPIALYLAWNWGVPEQDWQTVLAYPDVKRWVDHELKVLRRVDRLMLPCRDAADELIRCDARFGPLLRKADLVLTGGAAPPSSTPHVTRGALRARWRLPIDQRVGLFIGSAQAYRGLDALLAGLALLRDELVIPGTLAIAGPDPTAVPARDRTRVLGRVDDVTTLLRAVDFVVNVNRFSLFDLSLVEAAEAGRPLLLHGTGGNRTMLSLGAGVVPIANLSPSAVAEGLERVFGMPQAELDALGARSRRCYEEHLQPAQFGARHLALYDKVSGLPKRRATA